MLAEVSDIRNLCVAVRTNLGAQERLQTHLGILPTATWAIRQGLICRKNVRPLPDGLLGVDSSPMLSLPLSPRLVALPLWAFQRARAALASRGQPILQLTLSSREPLPDPALIRLLIDHPEVRGLWIRIESMPGASMASLGALRAALLAVRSSGRKVFMELESCGNSELYLASAVDKVWIRPTVQLYATGLGLHLTFWGALLERFGARFDVEAVGTYKSFGESYTRGFPTPENREALQSLLNGLQTEFETGIAEGRGISVETVRTAIEDAPLFPEDALKRGLIDGIAWADEVEDYLKKLFELEELRTVSFEHWAARWRSVQVLEQRMAAERRVAVLHLQGTVVDGEAVPGSQVIAAASVESLLKELGEREDVAAVVLHVDSPGGSATASDRIWRAAVQVQRLKPVVASLGNVAASGGYYIACAATEILALPATLTGSIGVVGGKLVLGEALARQGVHSASIPGAPQADLLQPTHAFSPEQRLRFREGLQHFYKTFLERVAAGRRQPTSAIEPHAKGRVWTGRQALDRGLVDQLGGVSEAMGRAAHLAGLSTYSRLDVYGTPPPGRIARLVRRSFQMAAPELRWLGAIPPELHTLSQLKPGAWAIWPFFADIS